MTDTDQAVATADPTASGEGSPNGSGGRSPVGEAPATTAKPTVYQAIADVIAEIPGVPKDQEGPVDQGRYKYRGIENIKAAAQRIMARHGVTYSPKAKLLKIVEHPPNAKAGWQDWIVEFTWTVRGPAGDRVKPSPVTIGVGRDNSDKGVNKAHSQAEKYMLTTLLQIADGEAPEPDAHGDYGAQMTPDEAAAQAEADANPPLDGAVIASLRERIRALGAEPREQLSAAWMREDPDGDTFLPVHDGKPAVGLLRKNDRMAAEALILQAEKAAESAAAEASKVDQAQSLADRAASHGRQEPQERPAAADSDASTADAAGEPQPGDPTWAVPAGTIIGSLVDRDLADVPIAELAGEVRAVGAALPSAWVTELTEAVGKLHQTRVDRELTGVEGQTKADGEDIQHRRLRVSLVRMLIKRDSLDAT